jgi:predicted TIM-barrel fold metal-dependent hydrolase
MTTTLDGPGADSPIPDFLLDPPAAEVHYTLISVDDHLVEPAHAFEGRLPSRLQDAAPRVIDIRAGTPIPRTASNLPPLVPEKDGQAWLFDDQLFVQVGLNAIAGHTDRDAKRTEPATFDDMRPGCYDVDARVHDMDLGGIWASVNFPSQVSGFCGTVYSSAKDPELGLATTKAWNDWLFEEWHLAHPERIVPMGLTFLTDPEVGAEEIRRNAARGFTAVTLPELPHRVGLPEVHDTYWDPIWRACVDTGTAIALHVGSSGMLEPRTDPRRFERNVINFPTLSLIACIEWLFSGVPSRFPDLQIVLAEGGIGWVPMLLDRLDYTDDHAGRPNWTDADTPAEVLQRNFSFCMLDDPSTLPLIHRIGVENVMMEVDYPHSDSTWPTTQALMHQRFDSAPFLSKDDIRAIACGNAARVFRHPLPPDVRP